MSKNVKTGFTILSLFLLLIFAFQNCSPAFSPMGNDVVTSSGSCSNDALAGTWTSNPDDPSHPQVEELSISNGCVATSKLCGGSISFSQIPSYDGMTPIQGSITLNISGATVSSTCLPNGPYQCTYGLGPSSRGDVFGARCNDQYDLLFYRLASPAPAATPTPAPTPVLPSKIIYFTTNTLLGNFGGAAQADAICMSDPGRPAAVTSAKALLASSTRRACTTPNCSGGASENLDWVLKPTTQYKRPSGVNVGVTNASGVFVFDLQNPIWNDSGAAHAWTGLQSNWTSDVENCSGWTSTTGMASVGHFQSVNKYSIGLDSSVPLYYRECNSLYHRLICVEQ